MINTRLPAAAASTAMFEVMFVFPTPPLPEVTATTRTSLARSFIICRRLSAWSMSVFPKRFSGA